MTNNSNGKQWLVIRDAASNGSCTGHCIDINYKGGNFETKKSLGFGLPLQGNSLDGQD